MKPLLAALAAFLFTLPALAAADAPARPDNTPPPGFIALFNGKDLTGWKGLPKSPLDNPFKRKAPSPEDLKKAGVRDMQEAQAKADQRMRDHWKVVDGTLVFSGRGDSLCTAREDYGDFELLVDWKIERAGDSGIYLRGTPQVQIWDAEASPQNAVGSGGLFNNKKHPSKPSKRADKPVGQWNTFWIKMVGDKVWVKLNDELVVDGVVLENYWDYSQPIFPTGQIELQNHGNTLYFKNIYIKELPR
jgi:hypothetical protein